MTCLLALQILTAVNTSAITDAPEEHLIRGWVKAPVAASLTLDNGRQIGLANGVEVFAPDGTVNAPSDIRPTEPVEVTLDESGKAIRIIRWNEQGVVTRKVDVSHLVGDEIELNSRDSVAVGSVSVQEFLHVMAEDAPHRSVVLRNAAHFDAVGIDCIARYWESETQKGASFSILSDATVLYTSPIGRTRRGSETDVSGRESVQIRMEVPARFGGADMYLFNLTLKRYAWNTPKPTYPQPSYRGRATSCTWSAVDKAEGYLVEVQRIAGEPLASTTEAAFISAVTRDTSFNLSTLPPGTYRWRVSSLKGGAIWGQGADWRTFEQEKP